MTIIQKSITTGRANSPFQTAGLDRRALLLEMCSLAYSFRACVGIGYYVYVYVLCLLNQSW